MIDRQYLNETITKKNSGNRIVGKWTEYETMGKDFNTLKEAKKYIETVKCITPKLIVLGLEVIKEDGLYRLGDSNWDYVFIEHYLISSKGMMKSFVEMYKENKDPKYWESKRFYNPNSIH